MPLAALKKHRFERASERSMHARAFKTDVLLSLLPLSQSLSPSVPPSTAAVNIGYCSSDAKDAHSIPVPASAP